MQAFSHNIAEGLKNSVMQQNMHVVLTNTLSFFQLYVVQTQKAIVLLDSLLSCFIFVSFL